MGSNEFTISNGPSKFDLMLALFDSKQPNLRRVTFHLSNGNKLEASISAVQMEDGSGESWLFTATGRFTTGAIEFRSCTGYYDTVTRNGRVTIGR